jgi:hypothetical protein
MEPNPLKRKPFDNTDTIPDQPNPDLYRRSMRDVENNPMPPDDVIAKKVKEALADKSIVARFEILYYLFDRNTERLIEFWVRYSYDMQAGHNKEMTGWEPLPVGDSGLLEPIRKYYHSYFNDDRLTDTGKLGGKLDF